MKTKLTEAAERLVTCYNIGHPLDLYSQRLGRRQEKVANEAYGRLKGLEKVPENSPVYCNLAWEDAQVARGMRLGVEEFKKEHPEHADELENTIEHQRTVRRNYVEFGVKHGEEISREDYLRVMEEIGIPSNIAKSTLNTALGLSDYLKSKKPGPVRILMG